MAPPCSVSGTHLLVFIFISSLIIVMPMFHIKGAMKKSTRQINRYTRAAQSRQYLFIVLLIPTINLKKVEMLRRALDMRMTSHPLSYVSSCGVAPSAFPHNTLNFSRVEHSYPQITVYLRPAHKLSFTQQNNHPSKHIYTSWTRYESINLRHLFTSSISKNFPMCFFERNNSPLRNRSN